MTIEFPIEPEWVEKYAMDTLTEFSASVSQIRFKALNISIECQKDCLELLDLYSFAKDIFDSIEDARKKLCAPHREAQKRINDMASLLKSYLDDVYIVINKKREAFEQAEKERLEQAKIEAYQQSEALGIDLSIYIPESPRKLVSEHATTFTKEVKDFKVIDEALVPREYLMINPTSVGQAIKMGIREIPGIEITTEKKTTIRRR